MADSYLHFANVIVPIIGLCILLPLFITALSEPKKDYSRRVYLFMLLACAGILITEGFQWAFEGRVAGNQVTYYLVAECAFYLLLVCLCFFWTLYSYFWFNGHRPSNREFAGFIIGPLIEVCVLIANLYTPAIYSISATGNYARGSAFPFFIAFCYLYLIIAIAASAIVAMRRHATGQRRNLMLFLMFFAFPMLGPVMQYLFPNVALMGVSEAIALLAIYVSVQQRTTAEYAVERARFQDEVLEYERSLERMLAISPEALYVYRINLTADGFTCEQGPSGGAQVQVAGDTVDAMFGAFAALADGEDAPLFRSRFNRESLMQAFADGTNQLTMAYRRRVENGESHLIKLYLSMLQNPCSGDIEAIAYSVDVDWQEKEQKVISAITNREYDYIALIDASTRRIHYQYTSQKSSDAVSLRMGDYDVVMRSLIATVQRSDQVDKLFEKVSFQTVFDALQLQEEYSFVYSYPQAGGPTLQKKNTYRYLDDRKNEILAFRSDITEEMSQERAYADQLQDALQEAQRANALKTEFLSNVSHDMRTPLNAVLGYVNLARKSSDPAAVDGYLGKIDRAGNILLSLVNGTLDLSKIETGSATLNRAPIACAELVDRVVSVVRPSMDEKHIDFVLDNHGAVMATINVDALRVQEIFINLLSNAVKYTPEGGQVCMAIECLKLDDDCVHDKITVRDTGRGMAPEFLPKMFEPFAQEHTASDAGTEGSGLGLSIVKRLVDLMGGHIEVKSEQGVGTEFAVYLDFERVVDHVEEHARAAAAWERLDGRRILMAEDNAMNAEIARSMLEGRGMVVTSVENGQEACRTFADSEPGSFDAILMDLRMPIMNGRDAARAIRQMDCADAASIPIIAVSADAFEDDVRESLAAGMNGHLAKPIDPDALFNMLSGALA